MRGPLSVLTAGVVAVMTIGIAWMAYNVGNHHTETAAGVTLPAQAANVASSTPAAHKRRTTGHLIVAPAHTASALALPAALPRAQITMPSTRRNVPTPHKCVGTAEQCVEAAKCERMALEHFHGYPYEMQSQCLDIRAVAYGDPCINNSGACDQARECAQRRDTLPEWWRTHDHGYCDKYLEQWGIAAGVVQDSDTNPTRRP